MAPKRSVCRVRSSPITISILYVFRREYEITKLYGMRPSDLVYFMYTAED